MSPGVRTLGLSCLKCDVGWLLLLRRSGFAQSPFILHADAPLAGLLTTGPGFATCRAFASAKRPDCRPMPWGLHTRSSGGPDAVASDVGLVFTPV